MIALFLLSAVAKSEQSSQWSLFVEARKAGTMSDLSDFSFAGYKYSEEPIPDVEYRVFDVREFGAIANDGKSDKAAFVKAIRAAEENGSGVVYFPMGRFLINSGKDTASVIEIRHSNIVVRGAGRDKTTLHFEQDLPPLDPNKLWTVPYAIQTDVRGKGQVITDVVAGTPEGSHQITVASTEKMQAGDWVILEVLNNDPKLIEAELGGLRLEEGWTKLIAEGIKVNERHQVAAIDGNLVTFVEPVHYEVQAKHHWKLREFVHLEGLGFEDLTFEGAWTDDFVHHRSTRDDGGWSILKLAHATDSWVRNVTFRDVNRPLSVSGSAATTVINVRIEGHVGHHAISTSGGSTGVLLADITDAAGMWHSIGVGGGSTTGTVIWRSRYPAHTSFESHASQPRTTLFDNVSGGFFSGRAGGAVKNLPNHAKGLVLWNFEELDEPEEDFEFIDHEVPWWRIVPPVIVGFHGAGTTFKEGAAEVVESLGRPVEPGSLFEAQLSLRLGELPKWLVDYKAKHLGKQSSACSRDQ